MKVTIAEKVIDITESYDVAVIGGGPAGIGAAVAAARNGSKVVLIEKRGFLGGNITACYVENAIGIIHKTLIKPWGIYKEIEEQYKQQFKWSDDVREDEAPSRYSSEYLKVFLDEFILNEGISILLHAFVNDVVVENDEISSVVLQTKKGAQAIKAKVIIDATGDGDVAFSAGVPFEQGRASDGLCQPGTLNFGISGVNMEIFNSGKKSLSDTSVFFVNEHMANRTGVSCKRHNPCFGRLTASGQISYINYCDVYGIDPTDIQDLTRGEIEGRKYVMELYNYLKNNIEGMENIEITRIAPEIGFRDSRRIVGKYCLTLEDAENSRRFDDAIAVYPRHYDMLALDGNWDKGRGFDSTALHMPVEGERSFSIPFRCLVPVKIRNLLVAGRCISCDHIVESSIRSIIACMTTGQAAGNAAAIASKQGLYPGDIDIQQLQGILKEQGVKLA